jgi:hypothetical protein
MIKRKTVHENPEKYMKKKILTKEQEEVLTQAF